MEKGYAKLQLQAEVLLTGTEKTLLRYCEQVRKLKQSAVSDSGCKDV